MNLILALDFGGTKHAAAVVASGEKHQLSDKRVFSPPNPHAQFDLEIMLGLARELLAGREPRAIGVSFGGPVDAASGKVRLSHHVSGWENIPLQEILEREFGAPASVDNDANVAALGEHRYGAGMGYNSLLYITVSTGVGGGWILNDRPWRGIEGMAGEIGHVVVDPTGPVCLCGKRGCVERLASGPYIAQQTKDRLNLHPDKGKLLRSLCHDNLDEITGLMVSQAATQGDEIAIEALETAGWALGVAIGNVANLINPQRFILGGSVTKAGDRFWNAIHRVARATALPEVHFEIVPAALGDKAPLWGAVALAEDLLVAGVGSRKSGVGEES
ncbi:ROK family protein [Chroococcidiopsis sp. FACHB-1243]|uniref:ROK family protein n=1 Tax=Chroococcidiopsis sp. [FACHB-1243] TaxID=2692781 RepID=UPI001786B83D|nr:ROK family protein [Chroococcidiopsis sp. [FACHB-1243]]MBD2306635.1 ROK family protein [Chroococcidiopsis sp. [FACHB-1243]]